MGCGIVLDIGGVVLLVDSRRAAAELTGRLKLVVGARQVESAIARADLAAWGEPDIFHRSFDEELGAPVGVDAWSMLCDIDTEQRPLWSCVASDARRFLGGVVERGLPVAALSNSDGRLVKDLTRVGLIDRFEAVLDSVHTGLSKPDPEAYRSACASLAAYPQDCWYIGDTPHEVWAARELGLRSILLDRASVFRDDSRCLTLEVVDNLTAALGLVMTPSGLQ